MESKESQGFRYGKRGRSGATKKTARKKARGAGGAVYRRGGRALSSVALPRELVSDSYKTVDLVYVEYITLGGAVCTSHDFRLNSPFDPYYAAGGHQARGYDQWRTFYRRYRVTQTKISFQVADSGATFGIPAVGFIHVGNQAYGATPASTILELPGTVTQMGSALGDPIRLTQGVKLWELAGMTYKDYVADDTTASYDTTNPDMLLIGSCGVVSADASTTLGVWDGVVTIIMRVVFSEKITPASS